MAKITSVGDTTLSNQDVSTWRKIQINSVDVSADVMSVSVAQNITFGASSATILLANDTGRYSDGGAREIKFGQAVDVDEGVLYGAYAAATTNGTPSQVNVVYNEETNPSNFAKSWYLFNKTRKTARTITSVNTVTKTISTLGSNDGWDDDELISTAEEWDLFAGQVRQFSPNKRAGVNVMEVTALDDIIRLQDMDIEKKYEATRVSVSSETLVPTYLASPNEDLAQVFNFANTDISYNPPPTLLINDVEKNRTDPNFQGFEIRYADGQVKLGTPLNARNNYNLQADYSYYPIGEDIEDIIEDVIIQTDGYGSTVFQASDLQTTLGAMKGTGATDTMLPNYYTETIKIYTTLSGAVAAGGTSVSVDSTDGFPTSGSGDINGDAFTWTGISGSSLTGIPATGANSLSAHPSGAYVGYETTYAGGRVWYTSYNNITTSLGSGDFTVPGGSTVDYVDARYGRIILDAAVSVTSTVTCTNNYTFKTIQATGIQVNYLNFNKENTRNRTDAINKCRDLCAPNYVIHTKGDGKIWVEYMNQKITADHTLRLMQNIVYTSDPTDIYTRVVIYGANSNPQNLMFDTVSFTTVTKTANINQGGGITAAAATIPYDGAAGGSFNSRGTVTIDSEEISHHTSSSTQLLNCTRGANGTTAATHADDIQISTTDYRATAYSVSLTYVEDEGNWQVYKTGLNQAGFLINDGDFGPPVVYINDVAIDNNSRQMVMTQVVVITDIDVQTTVDRGTSSTDVSTTTYYDYTVYFSHSGIMPGQTITIYNSTGATLYTLGPNDANVDYTHGVWKVPGTEQNSTVTTASTATYFVFYDSKKLAIDYDKALFKISKDLVSKDREDALAADFEYQEAVTPIRQAGFLIDGRWNTQTQTVFFGEPVANLTYAIIDLGSTKTIDIIDLLAGRYKPDETRAFDFTNYYTIQYSTDNVTYSNIGPDATNFSLRSGETLTLAKDALGDGFEARYLKIILVDAEKIEFENGIWCIAFSELAAFQDVVLRAEATLIDATTVTTAITAGDTSITVNDTAGFASSGTAYIIDTVVDTFTYTGTTATTFTGIPASGGNAVLAHGIGKIVTESEETATTVYDPEGILYNLGDKVYKNTEIVDYLNTQTRLNRRAKKILREVVKKRTRAQVDVLYGPHLEVGETVNVVDSTNNIDTNYFIESITDNNGFRTLGLARYPGDYNLVYEA